jgi:hypothetical protein
MSAMILPLNGIRLTSWSFIVIAVICEQEK